MLDKLRSITQEMKLTFFDKSLMVTLAGLFLGFICFFLSDHTGQQLTYLQQKHRRQVHDMNTWQGYHEAQTHQTSEWELFVKFQKASQWNRTKIRQALEHFLSLYDLELKEFKVENMEMDKSRMSYHSQQIHLSVGGREDGQILRLLKHIETYMKSWIKIYEINIQRCGSVDESDNPDINLVEARFHLEWLLALREDFNDEK